MHYHSRHILHKIYGTFSPQSTSALNLRHDYSTLNQTAAVYTADLLRRIVARRHYTVVHFI